MTTRIQKRSKPTNPHWGRPMPLAELYGVQQICEFDKVVEKLQLAPDQYATSPVLKTWVKRHYRQRYVPEWLLLVFELEFSTEGDS